MCVIEWQKRLAFKYVGPFGEAEQRCIEGKVVRLEDNQRSVQLLLSAARKRFHLEPSLLALLPRPQRDGIAIQLNVVLPRRPSARSSSNTVERPHHFNL